MKIVHLCLGCFYPDNYSYQENLLPKYHKKLGYDVEVIASTESFDNQGKSCYLETVGSYQNEYDIKVTRLAFKSKSKLCKKLKRYIGVFDTLSLANPDILFIHGGQFLDIDKVVKYLRLHKNVSVYVDNHADFSNSATNWISKTFLHKIIWQHTMHQIEPYTKKFYGVLPARVDFLIDVYKLPPDKCELLVMGADDELVEKAKKSGAKERIRKQFHICDDDFLIVTGGKIDQWKTQTLLLMKAVKNINNSNLKILVFGSVTDELLDQVRSISDGSKIQYIGWIDSKDTYDYFEAADLVVFPGRHSVLWEQATGQGRPMIVKDWPGTHHIDLGGNVMFIMNDCENEIQELIESVLNHPEKLNEMCDIAEKYGISYFSYKNIAERSIC